MGLKIKLSTVIFAALLFSKIAFAGWTGPSEVLSGTWGNNPGQFAIQYGDTSDTFPTTMDISPSGRVAISEDQTLNRVQIFNSTGQLTNIINTFAFTLAFDANENIYVSGGGFRKYDSSGTLVWSKTGTSYDALFALSSGTIVGFDKDNKNYSLFSPTGQLIKTVTTRPAELGVVTEKPLGNGQYKITVTFPDEVWSYNDIGPMAAYIRDKNGNLYGYGDTQAARYTACGKVLALLTMPEEKTSEKSWGPGIEPQITVLEEYGSPVISPNGDVYTWKRTPDNYSILKWTWVDDPTVQTGPDAPTNLAVTASINGLYLTWTASPQDPGCVTGYEIDQATTSGGPYTTIATVNAGTLKYNDTTATAGTTYYYKIRAVSGSDYSPYTSEVSGKR